jgi:hypothetical protein
MRNRPLTAPLQAAANARDAAVDMPANPCRLRISICSLPQTALLPTRAIVAGSSLVEPATQRLTIHDIDFTIRDIEGFCDG